MAASNDAFETELLALVEGTTMTPEQQEEQRRSFVYGNTGIENPDITRELVDEVADGRKPSPSSHGK